MSSPPPRLDDILQKSPAASQRTLSSLSTADCLSLRLASRRLRASVDATEAGGRLFYVLCVRGGGVSERMRRGLVGIGRFCGEAVVCVGAGALGGGGGGGGGEAGVGGGAESGGGVAGRR